MEGISANITCQGCTVNAVVVKASPNRTTVLFRFEGILAGYAGVMPVMWNQQRKRYEDLINEQEVKIEWQQP